MYNFTRAITRSPFTPKFACMFRVTDFARKNTSKSRVFLYNSKYG